MENKIYYTKEGYVPLTVQNGKIIKAKEGQVISPNMIIAKSKNKTMSEVKYSGKLKVKIGDSVKAGDILYESGMIKKDIHRSEIDAKVINIENNVIYLENLEIDNDTESSDLINPFNVEVKIHKIYENVIYLKTSGLYINLLVSKGRNTLGSIMYIPPDKFNLKSLANLKLKDKIIVVDNLPSEFYPRLAALNVAGIITNSLDYSFYKNIILLSVPIGVYSGFGNIDFDKKTTNIFKTLSESNCEGYLDVDYNRLFIPLNKAPNIKNYEFESMSFK